ncbi:hypothetical protein MCOR25_011062 [Pyricularia grisea]|nr:hypothetical protein MCOR25_011062 [Pyricularia grisea]
MAYRSPSRGPNRQPTDDNDELAQSLRHLSLSARSPQNGTQRSPSSVSISRSPSSLSVRGPAPRSPLAEGGRPASRAGTPGLLRKASMNSLHSVNGVAPPRRASSVNISSPSASRSPRHSTSPPEQKPAKTAASVARDYFKLELAVRHGEQPDPTSETVVIMHDSCYGHRFSRPRTSRAALSTIVERPERIKASALGVAAAYVRLGERHSDGIHPIDPSLDPAAIPSIPFRIQKTTRRLPLMSQAVTNVHGTKWMEELKMMCDSAETKLAMNGKELQRPDMHRGPEQDGPPPKFHEGDLYLCSESLDALEGSLGGVCEAVDAVFTAENPAKRAFVAIRPPGHHCSASFPSGFCWVNNVHVGIMHGILSHGLTHAAIIDFDLHHGDGSQAIAWQHNTRGIGLSKNAAWWKKPSIGYFSLHDINSYPCEMGDEEKVKNASLCIENAHGQNIWNVHLLPWKTEEDFWRLYESKYKVLLDKTREFLRAQADRFRNAGQSNVAKGAIFLSAGFDASEWEGSGMQRHKVNVPTEFYARLTRDVVKIAAEEETSVEGRVISVLEGGYSDRALCSGILSHISGLAGDDPVDFAPLKGLRGEVNKRLSGASLTHARRESFGLKNTFPLHPYEAEWWHASELERLETTMNAPMEAPEPRKPRNATPPTYSSPTQSSQAKVVYNPSKIRRSLPSTVDGRSSPIPVLRAPTPPPPDVPWTIAAHELSKLLIPSDRQTGSCKPEDLNAEATRQRRDRQSIALAAAASSLPSPTIVESIEVDEPPRSSTRMSLRERKAPKSYSELNKDDFTKGDRRKTVAGSSVIATDKAAARGFPGAAGRPKQTSRRLSAASTVVSEVPDGFLPPPMNGAGARPSTSLSIRPESSMSVRSTMTTGGPLPSKKTRIAPVKKDVVPKAPRGAKKAVPASIPQIKTEKEAEGSRPVASRAPASTSPMQIQPKDSNDEMDSLTTNMKKVKITLLTKAQKEAREQKAAVPSNGNQVATPTEARSPTVLVPGSAPERMQSGRSIGSKPPINVSSVDSSCYPAAPSTPDMFIPFQPEGPAPEPHPQSNQQQQLQWLPPNVGTPSPVKRQDLPVFSATGTIPFASATGRSLSPLRGGADAPDKTSSGVSTPIPKSRVEQVRSMWEVPETPQK